MSAPLTLWTCEMCTLVNDAGASECAMCTAKPLLAVAAKGCAKEVDAGGGSAEKRRAEAAVAGGGAAKQTKRLKSGDREDGGEWACGACTMLNATSVAKCGACTAPREVWPCLDEVLATCEHRKRIDDWSGMDWAGALRAIEQQAGVMSATITRQGTIDWPEANSINFINLLIALEGHRTFCRVQRHNTLTLEGHSTRYATLINAQRTNPASVENPGADAPQVDLRVNFPDGSNTEVTVAQSATVRHLARTTQAARQDPAELTAFCRELGEDALHPNARLDSLGIGRDSTLFAMARENVLENVGVESLREVCSTLLCIQEAICHGMHVRPSHCGGEGGLALGFAERPFSGWQAEDLALVHIPETAKPFANLLLRWTEHAPNLSPAACLRILETSTSSTARGSWCRHQMLRSGSARLPSFFSTGQQEPHTFLFLIRGSWTCSDTTTTHACAPQRRWRSAGHSTESCRCGCTTKPTLAITRSSATCCFPSTRGHSCPRAIGRPPCLRKDSKTSWVPCACALLACQLRARRRSAS